MQLGFVIDHSRCIGCHACTVACKQENEVPLGKFRTWVKYVETGSFPQVKRSFAVLRCNQCTNAPCVEICPVSALEKRRDGIVDVDPDACIGCKACMQGCPYDALYLNEDTGTAEKCHFCAHRTERGLAPACAIVCPTEAIVPGDFDDPRSVVSTLKREHGLKARKVEAGTGPNVFYREVNDAAIDPLLTNTSGGYLWAQQIRGPQLDAQSFEALERKAQARTVYDVAHAPLWGWKITAYLFAKSLAAGIFLMGVAWRSAETVTATSLAFFFLAVTLVVLVADLKRPERFLYILLRPNWRSWLAKGSFILLGYSVLLSVLLALAIAGARPPQALEWGLLGVTSVLAVSSAAYTGFLFRQAKGRVLWMRRAYPLELVVQAGVGGGAALLLLAAAKGEAASDVGALRWAFLAAVVAHLVFALAAGAEAPRGREEEYRRALDLVKRGPWAKRHLGLGIGVGHGIPLALIVALPGSAPALAAAALLALLGLWIEKDVLVRAGQAMPIS